MHQEDHTPNEQAEEKQEDYTPNEQPEKEQTSATSIWDDNLWKKLIVAAVFVAIVLVLISASFGLFTAQWQEARIEEEIAQIQNELTEIQAETGITHEDYLDLLQRISYLEGKVWRLEIEISQLRAAQKSTPTLPEKAIPSPDFEGEAYIIPIGGF